MGHRITDVGEMDVTATVDLDCRGYIPESPHPSTPVCSHDDGIELIRTSQLGVDGDLGPRRGPEGRALNGGHRGVDAYIGDDCREKRKERVRKRVTDGASTNHLARPPPHLAGPC